MPYLDSFSFWQYLRGRAKASFTARQERGERVVNAYKIKKLWPRSDTWSTKAAQGGKGTQVTCERRMGNKAIDSKSRRGGGCIQIQRINLDKKAKGSGFFACCVFPSLADVDGVGSNNI